jgi:hypothetical protein
MPLIQQEDNNGIIPFLFTDTGSHKWVEKNGYFPPLLKERRKDQKETIIADNAKLKCA